MLANPAPILVAHFWSKVDVRPSGCWPWLGCTTNGYGRFRGVRAHRFAYTAVHGDIAEDLMVRHLCGNKLCCNPKHLETGTAQDNADDGARLGERMIGPRNHKTKLTDEQVRYILENPNRERGVDLAMRFGVSKATVSLIQSGKRRAA